MGRGVGPWTRRVLHIVNGLIIGAALVQMLWSGFRLLRAPAGGRARFAADLVLAAPVIALVGSPHVSSLTTDSVSAVVLYVLVSRLFAVLANSGANARAIAYELGALATLCVLAVASKLSAVGFAGPAWLLVAWVTSRRLAGEAPLRRRTLACIVATALLFGGVYAARGVIQSGYPAFPSSVAAVSVDWRTPREMGDADRALIRYRARHFYDRPSVPGSATDDTPLDAPWVLGWIRHIVLMPMVLEPGLIILLALLVLASRRRRDPEKSPAGLLLLPLVVGLAFWFWSAPNPRFGQFLLWIAAAAAVGEAFRRSAEHLSRRRLAVGVIGAVVVVVVGLASSRGSLLIRPGSDHGFHPMVEDSTASYQTTSGLLLHYPVANNRCWDAPLPCTPYPAPNLRLRVPNDLAKGFQTDGPWQPTNWPNRGSHFLEMWRAAHARPAAR